MRTRTLKLLFLTAGSVAFITSCNHSSGGFDTDSKTGVVYRFIKHDDNGKKGMDSDFARVIMVVSEKSKSGKDSILFDSRKNGGDSTGTIPMPMLKTFTGCLGQGLQMMSPGDSAQFEINADSFFVREQHRPANRIPPGITGSTIFTWNIKYVSLETKKEMDAEINKQRMQQYQQFIAMRAKEYTSIADYLKTNKYEKVKQADDSIYYLETKKGKGKQIEEGDSVQIKYVGTFLDGKEFDKSDHGPGHQTMGLIYSKDERVIRVIQGWIDVLGKMHQGDKYKVLIPSMLAYGPRGYNGIPPATPVIFDMEAVSVKSNK